MRNKVMSILLFLVFIFSGISFGQGLNVPGSGSGITVPGQGSSSGSSTPAETTAADVTTSTTNFSGNLSATEDTLQKALDALDDMSVGSSDTVRNSITALNFTSDTSTMRGLVEYADQMYTICQSGARAGIREIDVDTGVVGSTLISSNSYTAISFGGKLYVGGYNQFFIYDGTTVSTYTHADIGLPANTYVISLIEFNDTLYAGLNNSTVYKRTSDTSWTLSHTNTNYASSTVYFDTDASGDLYSASYKQIYKLTDVDNDTWTLIKSTSYSYLTGIAIGTDYIYTIYQSSTNGGVVKTSLDGATSYHARFVDNSNYDISLDCIWIDETNNLLYVAGQDLFYYLDLNTVPSGDTNIYNATPCPIKYSKSNGYFNGFSLHDGVLYLAGRGNIYKVEANASQALANRNGYYDEEAIYMPYGKFGNIFLKQDTIANAATTDTITMGSPIRCDYTMQARMVNNNTISYSSSSWPSNNSNNQYNQISINATSADNTLTLIRATYYPVYLIRRNDDGTSGYDAKVKCYSGETFVNQSGHNTATLADDDSYMMVIGGTNLKNYVVFSHGVTFSTE